MVVKAGFRQTEIGEIPADWRVGYLQQLTDCLDNLRIPLNELQRFKRRGDIPYCGANGILDYIDDYLIDDDIILMAEDGGYFDEYLTRPIAYRMKGKCWVNNHAHILKAKSGIDQSFIYYSLVHKNILRFLSSGTRAKLNRSELNKIELPLPPTKTEQEAIAEVLSAADDLTGSLEQLISKKRHVKQGAMQELLHPKYGWVTGKLGDIGNFLKGSGVRKDEAMSGTLPCVRYGEIYTTHNNCIKRFHSWISKDVAATSTRLKKGDLLFAGSGETKEEIGKCVAFVDNFEAYAGGDIVILRPNAASPIFMGYYLNSSTIKRQKASKGQGDAVVHISATALASIDITIPKIEEQTTVATILSDMDAEIAALEEKLAKARLIKQGMLRELLTGKIRLLSPEQMKKVAA